jgi:glycerol-3-phosphate acyltransferase PlsX
MVKIAIDAMGGDFGSSPILGGVIEALEQKEFFAILFGDESEILTAIPTKYHNKIEIIHTTDVISMSDAATDALKRKETTIFKAIDCVRNGQADAVVSAGHSGATMSLATLRIGRIKGIARPAIATLMPTIDKTKETLVLDVGANVDCKSEHLLQFALMGEEYAKNVLNIKSPKVGLLSNGEEKSKGNEVTKDTYIVLKDEPSFIGNVEGSDIFKGTVDVVVCDGFVGNLILKTSEGVADTIGKIIKTKIKKSWIYMFGAIFMKPVFNYLKKRIDYAEYGGAPLLGVKKCVIISHGKSNSKAIKNAIFQAINFANSNVNENIENRLKKDKE